jgi:hypothetical protein
MRWQSDSQLVVKATETAGVVTATVISQEWNHFGHPQLLRVEVTTSAVTQVGTITFEVQQLVGAAWATLKASAAITAAGTAVIRINTDTDDKALTPIACRLRVVVNQGNAGDKTTVSAVRSYQFY